MPVPAIPSDGRYSDDERGGAATAGGRQRSPQVQRCPGSHQSQRTIVRAHLWLVICKKIYRVIVKCSDDFFFLQLAFVLLNV